MRKCRPPHYVRDSLINIATFKDKQVRIDEAAFILRLRSLFSVIVLKGIDKETLEDMETKLINKYNYAHNKRSSNYRDVKTNQLPWRGKGAIALWACSKTSRP